MHTIANCPRWALVPDDTIEFENRRLTRIRALVHMHTHGVRPGDLGGYIEKVSNLSRQDNAWVGAA